MSAFRADSDAIRCAPAADGLRARPAADVGRPDAPDPHHATGVHHSSHQDDLDAPLHRCSAGDRRRNRHRVGQDDRRRDDPGDRDDRPTADPAGPDARCLDDPADSACRHPSPDDLDGPDDHVRRADDRGDGHPGDPGRPDARSPAAAGSSRCRSRSRWDTGSRCRSGRRARHIPRRHSRAHIPGCRRGRRNAGRWSRASRSNNRHCHRDSRRSRSRPASCRPQAEEPYGSYRSPLSIRGPESACGIESALKGFEYEQVASSCVRLVNPAGRSVTLAP